MPKSTTTMSSVQSSKSKAYSSRTSVSSLSGGYSADRESVVSDHTSSSSSSIKHGFDLSEANKMRIKRIKLQECNFLAANALQDIKGSKKPFLLPKVGTSTNFMGGIDLTKVNHFVSSAYSPSAVSTHRAGPDDFSRTLPLLNNIFVQVAPFYLSKAFGSEDKLSSSRDSDMGSSSDSEAGTSIHGTFRCPLEIVA
jgi:hypothetical protein